MSTTNRERQIQPAGGNITTNITTNQQQQQQQQQQQLQLQQDYDLGMTPSIITTINNTSPRPMGQQENSVENSNVKTRRQLEPYESYIEDSFVGHWEREDDDDLDDNGNQANGTGPYSQDDDEPAIHASTIEFDFDSFGPESFLCTPTSSVNQSQTIESNDHDVEQPTSLLDNINLVNETNRSQVVSPATVVSAGSPVNPATTTPQPQIVSVGHLRNISPLDNLVDCSQIDYKVIEPYKKVISHAGYCHIIDPAQPAPKPDEPAPAIIVFSACYLPDRSRRDYDYVMDQLFLYVLFSLHELIADDYILIYLHNTQPSSLSQSQSSRILHSNILTNRSISSTSNEDNRVKNNLPTFTWMKRCYQMIDRKLRKNLRMLYLVKPTFWLKTVVIMCKPFISSKFSRKLQFIQNMDELRKCLPVDTLTLPASADNI